MTRFVLLSDLHCCFQVSTQPGDVLVCAGDMTLRGDVKEFEALEDWISRQPQTYKYYLSGNHDMLGFSKPILAREILKTPTWINDKVIEFDFLPKVTRDSHRYPHMPEQRHLKMFGSPWTFNPFGPGHWAFPLYGGIHSEERWAQLPQEMDILVTHGPPYGIADEHWSTGQKLGDHHLLNKVEGRSDLVHIFGHIHSGAKQTSRGSNLFLNVAVCDEMYEPSQPITIVDFEDEEVNVSHVQVGQSSKEASKEK